ncbi:hypothetical protein [Thermocrinis sp.]
MRSWSYLIQVRAYSDDGRVEEESALYVVSLPPDPEFLKNVELECYATSYLPFQTVLKVAHAYAIGTDAKIEDLERYSLMGYREDMDLYIFKEGVGFKEGLIRVFSLILDLLKARGTYKFIEPVVDVGTPPSELMLECLELSSA